MQKHFYLHFCILCESLKVCIVKCILSGGKPASLKEIIKHNDLPLDVQFAGNGDQSMINSIKIRNGRVSIVVGLIST
jgi:hypothetical protein